MLHKLHSVNPPPHNVSPLSGNQIPPTPGHSLGATRQRMTWSVAKDVFSCGWKVDFFPALSHPTKHRKAISARWFGYNSEYLRKHYHCWLKNVCNATRLPLVIRAVVRLPVDKHEWRQENCWIKGNSYAGWQQLVQLANISHLKQPDESKIRLTWYCSLVLPTLSAQWLERSHETRLLHSEVNTFANERETLRVTFWSRQKQTWK